MENYAHEFTDELAGSVDLTVKTLPGRPDGVPPGAFPVLWFGFRTVWHLLWRATQYNVIHLCDMASWPIGLAARLRNPAAQIVATAHGTDVAYPLRSGVLPRLYGAYLRLGARLLSRLRIAANSHATAGLCRKAGFENVHVVPLAVREAPELPNLAVDRYVLFVGRLVRRKGCRWFVTEVLPKLEPDIRLKVAGTIWDDSERQPLDNPRVDFLGPVFGKALAELRQRAIAVVMPNIRITDGNLFEGFGLTALEAVADGGVLCAAKIDGIVDAVRDGETGFLLTPGDAAEWASKISEISEWDGGRRDEFVRRAREVVSSEYSWPRVVRETVALYSEGSTDDWRHRR
jgi:glycosyltransferase involved in cell wall biosynthesis